MYYSYFNFKKRNKCQFLIDESSNNKLTNNNRNMLFDKYMENITKYNQKKNTLLTKILKTQEKSTDYLHQNICKNTLNIKNNTLHFGTEHRLIKRNNNIIPIKASFYEKKIIDNFLNDSNASKDKDMSISLILKKNIKNLNQSNNMNTIDNNKIKTLLNKENEPNIDYNNKILKLKLKGFLIASKESFNKENNFNHEIRRIIHNLRIFNKMNNNSGENSLDMPKINDNKNHNCCFSLKKINCYKKDNYSMTDNRNKHKNKLKNKFNSINNERESLNKNLNIIYRNRNSMIKDIKSHQHHITSQKIVRTNIFKNILKKKKNNINIIKRNPKKFNEKLSFMENMEKYLSNNFFINNEK